jgi:hypothetical protein
MVSSDKPGASDQLMLWIGNPSTTTSDEGSPPRLNLTDNTPGDDEGADTRDDSGSIDALIRELKGQRWDADKSVWK